MVALVGEEVVEVAHVVGVGLEHRFALVVDILVLELRRGVQLREDLYVGMGERADVGAAAAVEVAVHLVEQVVAFSLEIGVLQRLLAQPDGSFHVGARSVGIVHALVGLEGVDVRKTLDVGVCLGAFVEHVDAEGEVEPARGLQITAVAQHQIALVLVFDAVVVALVVEHDARRKVAAHRAEREVVLLEDLGAQPGFTPLLAVVVFAPGVERAAQFLVGELSQPVGGQQAVYLAERVPVRIVGVDKFLPLVVGAEVVEIVLLEFDHFCGCSPAVIVVALPLADRQVGTEVDGELFGHGPFGLDDDHAVRGPGTINRGGRGILQDGDVLDVIGIDRLDRAFDRQPVDHDERIGAGLERPHAADGDGLLAALARTVVITDQAGDHPLQTAHHVTGIAAVERRRGDHLIGSGGVLALEVLVAGYHHLVHERRARFERGDHKSFMVRIEPQGLRLHADIGDNQTGVTPFDKQRKLSVDIGNRSGGRPLLGDGGSYERVAVAVGHDSRNEFLEVAELFVGAAQDDGLLDDFVFQPGEVPDDAVENLPERHVPIGAGNRSNTFNDLLLVDKLVAGLFPQIGENLLEAALRE